jgi:hypothetical protein
MTYTTEFPHYDDTLSLPEGWTDTSWHNDTCPSFERVYGDVTFRLWCDFKDPEQREVTGRRFTVCVNLDKNHAFEDDYQCIGQSDSLGEALALINEVTA